MEVRDLLSGYTNSLMALRVHGFWDPLETPIFHEVRDQVLACLTEDQKLMMGFSFEGPIFQIIPPIPDAVLLERISGKDISERAKGFLTTAGGLAPTQWHWSIVEGAANSEQRYKHLRLEEMHFPSEAFRGLGFEAMNLRNYLVLWMTHCLRGRRMDAERYTILHGEGVKDERMLTAMTVRGERGAPELSLRTVSTHKPAVDALDRLQLTGVLKKSPSQLRKRLFENEAI